jgi:multidrug efflux pump subunit AcrA (membrane-fusion protein)
MRARPKYALIAVAALVVVGGGLAIGWRTYTGLGSGDGIPTLVVEREKFARRVTAEGTLKAAKATPVVAPPEARGRLKISWLATEGSLVKEGDVVIRFDPSEFEQQLENSEADRKAAETKMAKERVQTGAVLRGRDRSAQLAEAELERTREFQRKDVEIFSRNQIIESEIDESLSTARKDHAGRAAKIESKVSRSKIGLLTIERRAAQTQLDQANQALAALEVKAPHDGIMVFRRNWRGELPRVGDSVWRGQSLAEIPLPEIMEAEVFVLEADAGGLQEGLPATVIIEAHPLDEYQAKIKRVDKLAKPRQRGVPIQYFGVILELERTVTEVMKPGQRVRGTILFEDQEAIVVPRQAVFEKDGATIVYRRSGGEFEPVVVKLGTSTPGRSVVEEGLEEGDEIALRDPTRPADQPLSNGKNGNGKGKRGPSVNSR